MSSSSLVRMDADLLWRFQGPSSGLSQDHCVSELNRFWGPAAAQSVLWVWLEPRSLVFNKLPGEPMGVQSPISGNPFFGSFP